MSKPKPPRTRCPLCGGPIQPLQSLILPRLGPNQQTLVNAVMRAHGERVPSKILADRIWAHDPNGGPKLATKTVAVMVRAINKKTLPFKFKIECGAGRHDGYKVVYL